MSTWQQNASFLLTKNKLNYIFMIKTKIPKKNSQGEIKKFYVKNN